MEKTQNAQCALVIIGNEILSGRTTDKNMQYIGEKMAAHGVPLKEVRVVPDVEEKVIEAVNALRVEYDHVFTTGGIGPTHDDITAECISKAFGVEYKTNDEAFAVLTEYPYSQPDLRRAGLHDWQCACHGRYPSCDASDAGPSYWWDCGR
jgi:molybdenum cofactor synthesis domain-containing protein